MTPGWLKMVSRWSQDVPRWFQEGSKMTPGWLKMAPRWLQDGLKMVSRWLQDGSRQAQLGLRQPQDGSQKATTWLEGALHSYCKNTKNHCFLMILALQVHPMRPRSSSEGTWTRQTRPSASYKHTWHLKLAQEGLIELQEGSKMTPGWLKMVSRWLQDGSKMAQDRPSLA